MTLSEVSVTVPGALTASPAGFVGLAENVVTGHKAAELIASVFACDLIDCVAPVGQGDLPAGKTQFGAVVELIARDAKIVSAVAEIQIFKGVLGLKDICSVRNPPGMGLQIIGFKVLVNIIAPRSQACEIIGSIAIGGDSPVFCSRQYNFPALKSRLAFIPDAISI